MNRFYRTAPLLALVMLLGLGGVASAQSHPVEGTYAVTAVGSEIGTVAFNLVLKKTPEKWTGEITEAALPMAVKTVTVDADNKVTIIASAGDAEVGSGLGRCDDPGGAGASLAGHGSAVAPVVRPGRQAGLGGSFPCRGD